MRILSRAVQGISRVHRGVMAKAVGHAAISWRSHHIKHTFWIFVLGVMVGSIVIPLIMVRALIPLAPHTR